VGANAGRKKPTVAQMLGALRDAGYLFQNGIVLELEAAGYSVMPDYSFPDRDTGKLLEIDISATKRRSVRGDDREPRIYTKVLASCRDNANPLVFFTRDNDNTLRPATTHLPINGVPFGWPFSVADPGRGIRTRSLRLLQEHDHRLTAPRVSSQFCAVMSADGSEELTAESEGLNHELLVPLIKAMRYKGDPAQNPHPGALDVELIYPLVILSDEMYECAADADRHDLARKKHVVVYRKYRSAKIKGVFTIDVIARSFLGRYRKLIEAESERVREFLKDNLEGIRECESRRRDWQKR
jgi:hypothetical protein